MGFERAIPCFAASVEARKTRNNLHFRSVFDVPADLLALGMLARTQIDIIDIDSLKGNAFGVFTSGRHKLIERDKIVAASDDRSAIRTEGHPLSAILVEFRERESRTVLTELLDIHIRSSPRKQLRDGLFPPINRSQIWQDHYSPNCDNQLSRVPGRF